MPETAILISLGALLISAVNFFLALAAFRRTHFGRISIDASHSEGAARVDIGITNTGARPVALSQLRLAYGVAPSDAVMLMDVMDRFGRHTLALGESRIATVTVEELRSAAAGAGVRQGRYRRIWVHARIAGGSSMDQLLQADRTPVPAGTVESAVIFIASDLLLGFKPLEPEIFPRGTLR
jgi:hypothetical protein